MITIVTIYLYCLTIGLLLYMLRQYLRGEHDLLSVRNFAILGFIVFQLMGPISALQPGNYHVAFILQNPGMTSVVYALMATVFLVVFFWSYNRANASAWLAKKTPTTRAAPGPALLWILAVVLLGLAMLLRLGVSIPYLAQIGEIAAITTAAAACGIAGWIWAPRFWNPAAILGAAIIVLAAAIMVTSGTFGRRGLVALGGALLWGMYYAQLRYMVPRKALVRFCMVATVPVVAIALFSSVRDSSEHGRTAMEHVQAIKHDADLGVGLRLLFSGQDAGRNSLWLIEQFPSNQYQTRPLFTLFYLASYPIPRAWWQDKPEPLSTLLPHMAAMSQVNRDRLKLGPGIIGHAAAEGGWLALLIYAVCAGYFMRYLDEVVQNNLWSPLVLLAIGTSFGQLVGMARGETAAFAALFIIGVTSTYFLLLIFGKGIDHLTRSSMMQVYEEDEYLDEEQAMEWGYVDEPTAY